MTALQPNQYGPIIPSKDIFALLRLCRYANDQSAHVLVFDENTKCVVKWLIGDQSDIGMLRMYFNGGYRITTTDGTTSYNCLSILKYGAQTPYDRAMKGVGP